LGSSQADRPKQERLANHTKNQFSDLGKLLLFATLKNGRILVSGSQDSKLPQATFRQFLLFDVYVDTTDWQSLFIIAHNTRKLFAK
jgi:hypothetical protein